MKRILLTCLTILFSYSLWAQTIAKEEAETYETQMTEFPRFQNQNKVDFSTDWFNFYRALNDLGTDLSYIRNFVFPDSTVRTEFSGGTYGFIWKLAIGQTFDPTSGFYLSDPKAISKSAIYTLDSIAIPYRYRRVQNGAPDTLVIQIFEHNQLNVVPATSWTPSRSYANPPYDPSTQRGDNPIKEFTVLLDNDDTTTVNQGIIQQEVDLNLLADQKVALAVHYFPGNPHRVGDTITWYGTPRPDNQINAFVMYDGRDNDGVNDIGFYNHELLIRDYERYNINDNQTWENQYVPGTAWWSESTSSYGRYADLWFQITYEDFDGINESELIDKVDLYPNPAKYITNVEYNIGLAQNAVLEFTDVTGQKKGEFKLRNSSGLEQIDVSDWAEGLYFYTLIVDGENQGTARLIVTK